MSTAPTTDMLGGLKMPRIGYGTFLSTDEKELEVALDTVLETGYRHIDTAHLYLNEGVIGRVLKNWFSSGKLKREDVFITTKLPFSGVNPDRVEMFMKKSLENLQLDYVDLYLIHFPAGTNYVGTPATPNGQIELDIQDLTAVWKKMEEQVDAGRTKSIGLSNFNIKQIEKIIKSARVKPACLQIELHASLQQRELVNYCQKNGMVLVAYAPLGAPGYNKFLNNLGMDQKPLPSLIENTVVAKIAKKHNKANSQILLRFLIEKNIVPIPKSVTPSRIIENFNVFDFSLDLTDMRELEALEIGEDARIFDFDVVSPLKQHPEWPFPKRD